MAETRPTTADIQEHLRRGDARTAAKLLLASYPAQGLEALSALPSAAWAALLRELPPEEAAQLLEDAPDDVAANAVRELPAEQATEIVEAMTADDAADLIRHLPAEQGDAILGMHEASGAARVRELLEYPEESAGALMQLELIAIPIGMTAGEVVELLRRNAERYAEYPASYLYVVDDEGRLDGVLSLRGLLLCDADERVATIKHTVVDAIPVETPAEEVIRHFRRSHFLAIPVVDDRGVLLGVVTQEDAMRLAEQEAEEDLLRLTGIAGGDEFRVMPVLTRSRRRLSWLSLNVLLNVLAASVIALYQDTLEAAIALAVFLPIISDMSGCSGNQAVAVSIRELALERISPSRVPWVVGKELSVGLINGAVLGALLGGVAFIWKGNVALGAIVGGALWVNTLVAVVVGGGVPLLLRRFGRDPAMAAGPILTTLTDVCGFFVVLALASRFLHLL